MNLAAFPGDYVVAIGATTCQVTELHTTFLLCIPDRHLDAGRYPVKVSKSLTKSLAHYITYSLNYSLAHYITHTHSLTLTHSLTCHITQLYSPHLTLTQLASPKLTSPHCTAPHEVYSGSLVNPIVNDVELLVYWTQSIKKFHFCLL